MAPIAAVMTGPGAGAIATIQLAGSSAEAVLQGIFHRPGGGPCEFGVGRILLGDIVEEQQTIDQVTVGCEGPDAFAIHCHGNPLIVDRIMSLLQRRGVQPVRPEQLIAREVGDSIAAEAKLALTTVKTVEGATLIANQVKGGLSARARQWQAELDSTPLEQIAAQAKQILRDSDKARLILSGCTIVLIGPPNTGKSTLLNALAGREKAIVTDIRGTTRDWVTAEVRIPPLAVTLIDTAGLDPTLGASGDIDHAAQEKSIEALNRADLALLILDASQPADQLSGSLADRLVNHKLITVLNKADLGRRLDPMSLPACLRRVVHLSAKQEIGIDDLMRAICEVFSVASLSLNTVVTFTDRQRVLVERLAAAGSLDEADAWIADLLHAPIR
ncbi:MAG: GTPase [Phycisphaerales bacterium]